MLQGNKFAYVPLHNGQNQPAHLADYNAGLILYHHRHLHLHKIDSFLSQVNDQHPDAAIYLEQTVYVLSSKT